MDPQQKRVHVVFEMVGADCRTLPVAQNELMQWVETPDDQREDWTVALERHAVVILSGWNRASDGLKRWALQFAFADPHVCVLPAVDD